MEASLDDIDFMRRMQEMLGMDEDQVEELIDHLDSEAMSALTDALVNDDMASAQQIVQSINPDEDVNPLFRGENVDDKKIRKKKHRRKVTSQYEYKYGDDVQARLADPETGHVHYVDGTVYLPNGPDHTIGIKIQGKPKMVDRDKVRPLQEHGVLGMVNVPNLERMQQLAGIQPAATEITVPTENANMSVSEETDPCTAAQQAMAALDLVGEMLPSVRLADLKVIRQRIVNLQTMMNESISQ